MKSTLPMILAALIVTACDMLTGQEVARLPINKTSNKELFFKEATLSLKKGEKISFWTEMDMEFENDLQMVYTIELWKDSEKLGGIQLDALETNPTMMEVKTTFGDRTSWSYTGRMKSIGIEEDGVYTFKAALNSSENPTLLLKKAELVLKK